MREEQTKATTERLIFHVDVNSAFLSWESVRRIKEGLPDLRDIPACIGGDPTKRTGIVVAKSIPAKKCGVQTGEPVAMALRKCPNMVIVPSDFDLYVRCSRAFKKICAAYTPVMESFSIDEVFLDMTGTSLLYPDPIAAAHEIKDRIYEELGFTVNIGISTNKLLAKMASDFEKPNKVHTLFPEENPRKNVAASGTRAVVPRKSIRKETDRGRNPHNRRLGACARSGYPDADRQEKRPSALPVRPRHR